MLNRIIGVMLLAVVLAGGCATAPPSAAKSDFEELCRAVGAAQDDKISKEELLAAVRDKAQAEKIFEMCDTNKDAYLTVEEAQRRDWAIRQLLRLTPAPKLAPPAGRK